MYLLLVFFELFKELWFRLIKCLILGAAQIKELPVYFNYIEMCLIHLHVAKSRTKFLKYEYFDMFLFLALKALTKWLSPRRVVFFFHKTIQNLFKAPLSSNSLLALHKIWSITLRSSSVNVIKVPGSYRSGHTYWRNS